MIEVSKIIKTVENGSGTRDAVWFRAGVEEVDNGGPAVPFPLVKGFSPW